MQGCYLLLMLKVIIFDLDGVLVDSQPLQYKAYNQVFALRGFPITPAEWEVEWIHKSMSCRKWIEQQNLQLDVEEMRTAKREIYDKLIITELQLKPGVNQAISALAKYYTLSIASASMKASLDLIAQKFNFKTSFQLIISDQIEEIKRPKPFPDVFLYVAQRLGVSPAECVVIEDSVAGLEAAKAAGMKCVICPDSRYQSPESRFKQADKIIDSLEELNPEMIEKL